MRSRNSGFKPVLMREFTLRGLSDDKTGACGLLQNKHGGMSIFSQNL